ncbi:MAG: bifunctional DNA primase/polymerase [Alphaproteobacteria bacterium]|nr:bifunctional DNA primase/polymerase [Alphaproteobacteria bacterium]
MRHASSKPSARLRALDSILDAALSLSTIGFAVHWLRPNDKVPVDKGWPNAPIQTPESLRRSYRAGFNVGIRPGSYSHVGGAFIHVLDLDVREEAKAAEAYAWLDKSWPEWRRAPTVQSGSGGSSRHVYFFLDKPCRSKQIARSTEHTNYAGKSPWCWEIAIYGSGKNIVVPPSIHPITGKPYRWLKALDFDAIELGCAPTLSAELVQSWGALPSDDRNHIPSDNKLGLTIKEAKRILDKLPFEEWGEDRGKWVTAGMCLHNEFGESGYDLWCEWASQSSKFDETDSRRVWKSFNGSPNPLSMATLKAAAYAVEIAEMFDELPADEEDLLGDPLQIAVVPSDKAMKTAAGDLDAGQRFARVYQNKFLHIYSHKQWLRWSGTRWEECSRGEEVEAAKILAKKLLSAAASAVGENPNERNKAHLAYALRLNRDGSRLQSVLSMARSVPAMARLPDDFDTDSMLLGVKNGVIDLRLGRLISPAPSQMVSKQAGAVFDPIAACPRWLRFLEDVQPQLEIRNFLQRAIGYTLTGNIDEEKLFFAYGVGANGKSVLANVVSSLLGDYAVTVGAGLLTKSRNENESDRLLATLPGARLVLANETRQGDVFDDKRVKDLASRERIAARKLYSEAFSFVPTHKLWIRGNHLPGVLDNSDGFWRRLVPIEFAQQLAMESQIPDLDRQIIATELPGVLNWALQGCLEWQRCGLQVPTEIRARATAYREETDILGAWLTECCVLDSSARTKIEDAYLSYRWFCGREGMTAPSKPMFSRQVLQRPGLRRDPSRKSGRRIIGLVVQSDHDGFDELDDAA